MVSNGTLYGQIGRTVTLAQGPPPPFNDELSIALWSSELDPLDLPPPFVAGSGPARYLFGVSDAGYVAALSMIDIAPPYDPPPGRPTLASVRGVGAFGLLYKPDGSWIVFDPWSDYSYFDTPSNVTVITQDFFPLVVNNNGCAAGLLTAPTQYSNPLFWDGQSLIDIDYPGIATGLNDQKQVILAGSDRGGCLWEDGSSTVLVDHLPAGLRGQIQNIQPFSISNQVAPGSDATIHLLATAQINGADGTLVITRDNDGNWDFTQIQQPDGITFSKYVSINSHGAIAGIGNTSNDSGKNTGSHTNNDPSPISSNQAALLDTPVDIAAVFGYGGESGKEVVHTYLETNCVRKQNNIYYMNGKDVNWINKIYTVLFGNSEQELQRALTSPGCVVVYDGHSNMGLGPTFDPAKITRLSDFTNFGNSRTAINWHYLVEDEYPRLTTIAPDEIPAKVKNYNVPNLQAEKKLRYPNTNNVTSGEQFVKTGSGMNQKHFDRGASNHYLIVNAGAADLPPLKYDTFFYNSCNSGRDYIEVFTRGTLFYTSDECSSASTSQAFLEAILNGKRQRDVLTAINGAENVNKMIVR